MYGLGAHYAGLTIDQIAVKTMHDLAVRIVAAREAGNRTAETALRHELERVQIIFRGYATEAEKRAAAEEAAEFDPLGLKAGLGIAQGVGQLVGVGALVGLAMMMYGRRRAR